MSEASRRLQENISLMQTSEDEMQEAESTLQRMKRLAAQSADRATAAADRTVLNYEYTRYKFELSSFTTLSIDGIDPVEINKSLSTGTQAGGSSGTASGIPVAALDVGALGSIGSAEDAAKAVNAIDTTIGGISESRTSLAEARERILDEFRSSGASAGERPGPERRIHDANTARKMTGNMRSTMLLKPSESRLAQANAAPQGVLQLLA